MRAKTINFERGQDPYKALDIGLGETKLEINKALKDLQKVGINADWRESPWKDGIIELVIPSLEDYQVAYLPEEVKNAEWDPNDPYGWGLYELDDGDMEIEDEPWEKVLEKILELLT